MVMPFILVGLVPLTLVFYCVRNYYLKTSREIKRLEATGTQHLGYFFSYHVLLHCSCSFHRYISLRLTITNEQNLCELICSSKSSTITLDNNIGRPAFNPYSQFTAVNDAGVQFMSRSAYRNLVSIYRYFKVVRLSLGFPLYIVCVHGFIYTSLHS